MDDNDRYHSVNPPQSRPSVCLEIPNSCRAKNAGPRWLCFCHFLACRTRSSWQRMRVSVSWLNARALLSNSEVSLRALDSWKYFAQSVFSPSVHLRRLRQYLPSMPLPLIGEPFQTDANGTTKQFQRVPARVFRTGRERIALREEYQYELESWAGVHRTIGCLSLNG